MFGQVLGEVLGHALGQRGDQHAVAQLDALVDLGHQVIDLGADRADLDDRIDQAGRAHHQFGDLAFGLAQLVRPRRGRDIDAARATLFPLFKPQGTVVQGRGQAETELDQGFLARPVAFEHRADLRNGHVRFVDHQQRIRRQVVEQRRRWIAGVLAGEMPRVVLDAVAVADLSHHLQIELSTLRQALRFHQLVLLVQLFEADLQLRLDRVHRRQHALAGGRVMGLGIDGIAHHLAQAFAGQRIEHADLLDLAFKQLDAHRFAVRFGREHIDHFAAHAEGAAVQLEFVAGVLQLGQVLDQLALVDPLTGGEDQAHRQIVLGRAEAVDRRYRRHHDRIRA